MVEAVSHCAAEDFAGCGRGSVHQNQRRRSSNGSPELNAHQMGFRRLVRRSAGMRNLHVGLGSNGSSRLSSDSDCCQWSTTAIGAVAGLRAHARLLPLRLEGRQERPWLRHPFTRDTLHPQVARSAWSPLSWVSLVPRGPLSHWGVNPSTAACSLSSSLFSSGHSSSHFSFYRWMLSSTWATLRPLVRLSGGE